MPQDIRKPRDDGRIRLPPVDGGMNKIATKIGTADDKGTMLGAPTGSAAKKEKLLARIIKRMDKAISAESENRKAGLDDRKFESGSQWPAEVIAQRNLDKRPCLTFNKFPTLIKQVTNPQRQNRPSITVSPVGDRSDVEVAKMYRGLIRFIERDCGATSASGPYDTAFEDAVRMGWGYWRILTEWEAPDSFNLSLVIKRIRNPFTVYLDPSHQEVDGSDAKWGFITDLIPRSEFEEKWPDADPMPFTQGGIGETLKNWINKDEVRIAEYFEIEHQTRTLIALDNGHVGWEDELDDITKGYIKRGKVQILEERDSRVPRVMWFKVTAKDVLMEREWLGSSIPIVKVTGRELDIEGKVQLSGVVRHAKDAQRMINYWDTSKTEMVALAPKAPWVVEEGQIEGHEDEWKMANVRSQPYISYKATNVAGTLAPPPQRVAYAGVPAGIVEASQSAAQHMLGITGIRFDATMNERTYDESGKALREIRQSGDIGSFDFTDNLTQSLRRTGEILVELIPKIYDDKRVITILRDDDKEEQVGIDPSLPKASGEERLPNGKTRKVFNPRRGKYGVTVTIGPSYATKRIEAAENMISFMKALPQTANLIADLAAAEMDWPGAEKIAARLAKAVPPQFLTPDQKDLSPQVQALLASMDGQIKQLGQQLQQAMLALNDKTQDRALIADKIQKDFEGKLLKIVSDVETKLAATEERATSNFNSHIGSQLKDLGTNVAELIHAVDQPKASGDQDQDAMAQIGGGGADQGQPEPSAAPAQEPQEEMPPPEALQHLREGRVTTFGNKQKWTLRGGRPARVS